MKPSNLVYGLEDRPGPLTALLLGLQHVCIFSISLVFPVVLVRAAGGTTHDATFLVSMSLLAGGVGVVLQALRKGPVGSGYLCPQVCGPSFLSASMLAARAGGLPLVFGMTLLSGVMEGFFSRVMRRLRFLFPPEVTGLIVAMVGLTVVKMAGLNLLGMDGVAGTPDPVAAMVGFLTLAIMIGLNVWGRGQFRLFCIIIGMALGYGVSFAFGLLGPEQWATLGAEPLFWVPLAHHPGWRFDAAFVLPFLVAMVCSSLKSVGDLTTCQKINDAEWKRPDMENIGKGILADGAGCSVAGVLGGFGQSTSSANIGLSMATGATSRHIAWFMGGIMAALAFFPMLGAVFAIMPRPVIGATLLFALSFMVSAGFQIIMSRMMDNRKTFVVGVSLILGLMVDIMPGAVQGLPDMLQTVFASSLSTATIVAVVLNLVFRIGIASKAEKVLDVRDRVSRAVYEFLDIQGAAWGARKEVFASATAVISELAESILPPAMDTGELTVRLQFDEYKLVADLLYEGREIQAPGIAEPLMSENCMEDPACLEEDTLHLALSWRIVRHYGPNLQLGEENGRRRMRMVFEH